MSIGTPRLRELRPRTIGDSQRVATATSIETQVYRSHSMSAVPTTSSNSSGWITFAYMQFAVALGMAALAILFMPNADLTIKGFLLMSYLFTVGSTFTLAKTVRDEHEAKKLASRIEDARAEKLLMEVGR